MPPNVDSVSNVLDVQTTVFRPSSARKRMFREECQPFPLIGTIYAATYTRFGLHPVVFQTGGGEERAAVSKNYE